MAGTGLTGLTALALYVNTATGGQYYPLLRIFFFDVEVSFPTLLNFGLILLNSAFSLLIYLSTRNERKPYGKYWLGLAFLLLFMAYDEAAGLHEKLMEPVGALLPVHPLLHFPWTVVGAATASIIALLYVPFLTKLPRRVATLLLISGSIYLSGALGIETVGGVYDSYYEMDWRYHSIATVEEIFEMTGQVIFGYTALLYIATEVGSVKMVSNYPRRSSRRS